MTIRKILVSSAIVTFCSLSFSLGSVEAQSSEPFISEIKTFAGNFCPRGWAQADGQLLAVSSNDALFSLVGTMYGGDGRTTFGLPDLRGRAAMGQGSGPGLLTRREGQILGSENELLTPSVLPSHTHRAGIRTSRDAADSPSPQGNAFAPTINDTYVSGVAPNKYMHPNTIEVDPYGAGSPAVQNNRQPSLAVNYCIALVGIYPSRN